MSSIKNIVKVMNFHSLIRVDKAKQEAAKYFEFEKDITKVLYTVVNNRNLKLDKKMMLENPNGIVINIYLGNDLGFCGAFNSQVYSAVKGDEESYKIIIGKKIYNAISDEDKVLFKCEKEEFNDKIEEIEQIIKDHILNKKVKEMNIIYNHYVTISSIVYERKKVFPVVELDEEIDEKLLKLDFLTETNVDDLVSSLIVLYLCYNIKILECNSYAAENITRERITRESIKKIDEIETERETIKRIEDKEKNFKRQITNRQSNKKKH